jgi:hypothetical protein
MSQPNFQEISLKDFHAYILTHREDEEAFYIYVDRLHAEATWIEMPAMQSPEELDNYPEFRERMLRKSAS